MVVTEASLSLKSYLLGENWRQERNATIFVNWYADKISNPTVFLTPEGVVSCPSNETYVDSKKEALLTYLLITPDPNETNLGRSIFSEIAMWQFMDSAMSNLFRRNGMSLELAPISIDASSPSKKFYQKGADLYVAQTVETDFGPLQKPICGIDITLANGHAVIFKKNKPGLQFTTVMPVIILPLRDFLSEISEFDNLLNYLDTLGREAVLSGNYDDLFCGLAPNITNWLKHLLSIKILQGIIACDYRINESQDSKIISYKHLPLVFEKLSYMKKLMEEYVDISAIVV